MLSSTNRIGDFDRRITFQQKVLSENDFNADDVEDWEDISRYPTVPTKKQEKHGSENYEADKLTEVRSTVFTIRYREDITVKNRIVDDNGLIYDIISIIETARRRYQDIIAETKGEFFLEPAGGFSSAFSAGFNV